MQIMITLTSVDGIESASHTTSSVAGAIDYLDAVLGRRNYCPLDMWQALLGVGGHSLRTCHTYVNVVRVLH
jgi:hypothetical protein